LQHELIRLPVPPEIQILCAISEEMVQNDLLACAFLEALWLLKMASVQCHELLNVGTYKR